MPGLIFTFFRPQMTKGNHFKMILGMIFITLIFGVQFYLFMGSHFEINPPTPSQGQGDDEEDLAIKDG